MKLRIAASVVFVLIAATAFAADATPAPSDAQKSFDQLKALAGSWQGLVAAPKDSGIPEGSVVKVQMRITSRGNALAHEMYDWMKSVENWFWPAPTVALAAKFAALATV